MLHMKVWNIFVENMASNMYMYSCIIYTLGNTLGVGWGAINYPMVDICFKKKPSVVTIAYAQPK